MMPNVLIKNPTNGRSAWFSIPFYFGQLTKIGHSCSYDDVVEIIEIEGNSTLAVGEATLYDLERANVHAERSK
ncbi:TPA: hypothetical protein U1C81_000551 [Streptococcus suis]|nr:hypothetical protein [Streptococcus suis]HEM3720795.1 hypothetical protein [Streptococcus suis]